MAKGTKFFDKYHEARAEVQSHERRERLRRFVRTDPRLNPRSDFSAAFSSDFGPNQDTPLSLAGVGGILRDFVELL